jgi:phosphoesterase RecJ-like protein
MSIKNIIDCINKHSVFLITVHQNLEGDALGSEIAFYNLLKKMGKSAIMVNQDPVPGEYNFLKGAKWIKRYRHDMKLKFDVIVMLDCSDKLRCGRVAELAQSRKPVVNIDHHISNDKFGNVNWILPTASSVSEMIYRLYKVMHIKMDNVTAEALYVGILTDTGSFRYVNTTSFTHQIAAELLKFNLDVSKIYRNIYETISFSDILLLTKILLTLKRHASGKLITFEVKQKLLREKIIHFDLTENVLNFGRLIRGSDVCVLFKEEPDRTGQIRVNLRSRGTKVDVNRVARYFGGGGHRTASGCTVEGKLKDVKKRVIKKIKEQL